MPGQKNRLDPRTVPRSRLLDRLGPRRPALSVIALIDGRVAAEGQAAGSSIGQDAGGRQLILALCAGADPSSCAGASLIQKSAESLTEFVNRAAALGIGRLLALLPPGARGYEVSQDLLDRFAVEPWLGAVGLGAPGDATGGLIARESLWTALGGFEAAFQGWDWACRDFCLRARAIGYGAPLPSAAGDDRSADARLFAERAALAPDRSTTPSPAATNPSGSFTVYTAITNRYDSLKPQPAGATAGCEQVAFLDRDTASVVAERSRGWRVVVADPPPDDATRGDPTQADPHRAARFRKINAHLALPDSEYSLWIDASIGIACPFPLSRLAELFLKDRDLCVFRHHARRSVYEEAEACIAYGRDRADVIDAQIARYRAEGLPAASGLIEAPVLLRRHTPAIRALNEAWWKEIVAGSRRDQLSFNYVAWKLGLSYELFPLSLAVHNGLFVKFTR